ncbi:hypothetical protein WDW86_16845 [Bdellovibrionota bacterium FG-2]
MNPELGLSWASTVVFSKWKVVPHLEINLEGRRRGAQDLSALVVILPDPVDWCESQDRLLHALQMVAAEYKALQKDAALAEAMMSNSNLIYRYWLDSRGMCQVTAIEKRPVLSKSKLGEWPAPQSGGFPPLSPPAGMGLGMDVLAVSKGSSQVPTIPDTVKKQWVRELEQEGIKVGDREVTTANRKFSNQEYLAAFLRANGPYQKECELLRGRLVKNEITSEEYMRTETEARKKYQNEVAQQFGVSTYAVDSIISLITTQSMQRATGPY